MTESLPKITEQLDQIKENLKSGFGLEPTKEYDTTWGPTLVYGEFRVVHDVSTKFTLILLQGVSIASFRSDLVDADVIAGVIYFLQEER